MREVAENNEIIIKTNKAAAEEVVDCITSDGVLSERLQRGSDSPSAGHFNAFPLHHRVHRRCAGSYPLREGPFQVVRETLESKNSKTLVKKQLEYIKNTNCW